MKIRADFVTNSSSSSFVLAFKDEDSVMKELGNCYFPENEFDGLREIVISDVKSAERLTEEQVLERVKEELRWDTEYDLCEWYGEKHRCSYREACEWVKSPEGQSRLDAAIAPDIEKLKKKMAGNTVFVKVEYEDHTDVGAILENEVMPYLAVTLAQFYNH